MKVKIDRSGCIGCGLCAESCPEAFRMAEDGLAETVTEEVDAKAEETAKEACDNCPASVISVEE